MEHVPQALKSTRDQDMVNVDDWDGFASHRAELMDLFKSQGIGSVVELRCRLAHTTNPAIAT